jgi:hypothetical protein
MSSSAQIVPANTMSQCEGAVDKEIGALADGQCNPLFCLCSKASNYQSALRLHKRAQDGHSADKKLSPGAIAGVVIAVVVGVPVVAVVCWYAAAAASKSKARPRQTVR